MMEPYDNKMKKIEKKIMMQNKQIEQRVLRSDFEMMIIKKVDREDVSEMLESLKGGGEEVNKLRMEIGELNKKLRQLGDMFEKRFIRFRKELNVNNLFRAINSKADGEKTKTNLLTIDSRLNALADLLESMKKEFDGTKKLKKTVNAIVAIMTKDQTNALVTTSNVPQMCLSCGRGGAKFIPSVH